MIYNPRTTEQKRVDLEPSLAAHNWMDADGGAFVLALAQPGRILYCTLDVTAPEPVPVNVTPLCPSGARAAVIAGGYVAANYLIQESPEVWGPRRWYLDGTTKDVARPDANEVTVSTHGEVGFGYWGPAQFIGAHDSSIFDATCTPWKAETPPCIAIIDGVLWVVTGTEDPNGADPADPLAHLSIIARPIDSSHLWGGDAAVVSPGCLTFKRQPCLHPHAVRVGNELIITGHDSQGRMAVQSMPLEPLGAFPVDTRPPMPQPKIAFTLSIASTVAPTTVDATVSVEENTREGTRRWQFDGKNCVATPTKPNSGPTYRYEISDAGTHTFDLKVQGVLADAQHLPDSGGKIVFAGPQSVTFTAEIPDPLPMPKLKRGCQAGFGDPIVGSDNVYVELDKRGWNLARVTANADSAITAAILAEVTAQNLEPVIIVEDETLTSLTGDCGGLKAEYYNEPDLRKDELRDPAHYAARFLNALQYARDHNIDLHVGAISNPSRESLAWLRRVCSALPADVPVAFHRYPQNDWDVATVPRDGYVSRTAEFAAIRAAAPGRRLLYTEFGWKQDRFHQGGIEITLFGRTFYIGGRWRSLKDEEIRDRMRGEFVIVEAENARAAAAGQPLIYAATWYQVWEGDEDLFGLMRKDRTWKPQSDLLIP
jgi:hypothetical protein